MAHKKAGGSSRNGRDSNAQYLGVKAFSGERVSGKSMEAGSGPVGATPANRRSGGEPPGLCT